MGKLKALNELIKRSFNLTIRRVQRSENWKKGRNSFPKIKAIIVDIDGPITKKDLPTQALYKAYGQKKGKEKLNHLMNLAKQGNLNQALKEGHESLKGKITKKDWEQLARTTPVRTQVINALKKLQKQGYQIILATKGSKHAATHLAKKHGIKAEIIGTTETFDKQGKITGIKTLIGTETTPDRKILSKWDAVQHTLQQKEIKPSQTALITDEFTDIGPTNKTGYYILTYGKQMPTPKITNMTRKAKAYDAKINVDRNPEQKLLTIMKNPELMRLREPELEEHLKKEQQYQNR